MNYICFSEDCSDLVERVYSDSACSILIEEISISSEYSACNDLLDSPFPAVTSFKGFCSLGSAVPIPFDGFLQRFYSINIIFKM